MAAESSAPSWTWPVIPAIGAWSGRLGQSMEAVTDRSPLRRGREQLGDLDDDAVRVLDQADLPATLGCHHRRGLGDELDSVGGERVVDGLGVVGQDREA